MPRFTDRELTDMHFVYGFCNGSSLAAVREYQRRFPNRIVHVCRMFTDIHRYLSNHGSFQQMQGSGRPLGNHRMDNALNMFGNNILRSIVYTLS
ncbi:unnamed protein product [Acanthoscelides obtectus]|uniref:DUF4817 domain-containing protein n=1 Tax=Acanthoscelides obtectus TaxID=200917 RepID=A0A9P0PV05_ACAOB|nr:unnamed protein product [Acanthoscelides obtectus]CAH1999126.1 unnamed protein product [Acanthoscelides obtectus]CAK1674369.1 hypothetical protein AOBTE_LOCUS29606 [Acanthoscelides obtectus]CAK1683289.1 hypothetical protein AOBTE_LOCUS34185 [Acanthoscelides obtectus]